MKATALLLCGLWLVVAAYPNNNNDNNDNYQQADRQFLQKQQDLLLLFVNLQQPSLDQEQQQQANTFNFQQQRQNSNNPYAVSELQSAFQGGLVPRKDVFNYLNRVHRRQANQLFDLFYFAKDYKTFYQAACWARDNINTGLFTYSLSVAILNRPDTQGVALPPQSEVFPYLYINTRAIQQVQYLKQQGQKEAKVQSNNTDTYFDPYFNEDVNLNQQFAYEQLKNPAWFGGEKYQQSKQNPNQNNGENYFYYLQQLLARFNLERRANKLYPVPTLDFNKNIYPGYNPQLQYSNGQAVPARPEHYNIYYNANARYLQQFLNIDRRLADAVDSNQVLAADGSKVQLNNENGVKVLGDIIQNNEESVNKQFYGANYGQFGYFDQCRRLVGSVIDPIDIYEFAPSIIEIDNAAQRDTAFYQCLSRTVNFFKSLKNQQKPYKLEQLNFPGVKVLSIKTDKLVTYPDKSEVDLFNAVNYNQGEKPEEYKFSAQQTQLNYKPFNYQIQVDSNQNTAAIVRVFIAHKSDSMFRALSLEEIRETIVEIDRFTTNLKNGQNTIQRNSQDSTIFAQQQPSTRQLFRQLEQGLNGQTYYYNKNINQQAATFPQNLILPRGQAYGQEFFLVVSVNPYQGKAESDSQQQPQDNRPQGFPFDRAVREDTFHQAKNIRFETVKVFRRDSQQVNSIDFS